MTQMGLDIEAIEHLDFELGEPCEMKGCDHVAAWFFIVSCCGRSFVMCEEHKVNAMKVMEEDPTLTVTDGKCGTTKTITEFIAYMEKL